jgi:peptidoglycan/xylan/chitin deacetylase (PgdA/CDA1 family)
MSLKRFAARAISEICALAGNGAAPRSGLRILLYHSVGFGVSNDTYGLSIQPQLFERQMKTLKESEQLTIVNLTPPYIGGQGLRVAVTFDDGYKDNLYNAAPILLDAEIPFTVFVTSGFLRNGSSEYLDPNELKELASLSGVTIGSHGVNHLRLTDCDEARLSRELDDSRRQIEDLTGKPVTSLAYPHGSANRRVCDRARQAGYSLGVCSRFDINDETRDPMLLCRCEVIATDSERVFRQKISGAWDWYRWRERDPLEI